MACRASFAPLMKNVQVGVSEEACVDLAPTGSMDVGDDRWGVCQERVGFRTTDPPRLPFLKCRDVVGIVYWQQMDVQKKKKKKNGLWPKIPMSDPKWWKIFLSLGCDGTRRRRFCATPIL